MESNMDRSLDEILADRKKSNGGGRSQGRGRNNNSNNNSNNNGGSGSRRRERRDDYPRDGIRKSYRDDPRKIDEEWVHDRFDDDEPPRHRSSRNTRASPDRNSIARGTRIRVENLHYELTQEDLEGLFQAKGPVRSVELVYDRAGRSDGVAYVTYESYNDAKTAINDYDGANARGQPIRLSIVPSNSGTGGRRGGNPLDGAIKPGSGRPLAERITRPRGRRGDGEDNDDYEDGGLDGGDGDGEDTVAAAARRGIDRYVPSGSGGRDRSRSPRPRRREQGRRPGERRGGRDRDRVRDGQNTNSGSNSRQNGGNARPSRKTAEELDAEMDNYFGGSGEASTAAVAPATSAAAIEDPEDDAEMIG